MRQKYYLQKLKNIQKKKYSATVAVLIINIYGLIHKKKKVVHTVWTADTFKIPNLLLQQNNPGIWINTDFTYLLNVTTEEPIMNVPLGNDEGATHYKTGETVTNNWRS